MKNITTLFAQDSIGQDNRQNFLHEVNRVIDEDLRDAMQSTPRAHCRYIRPNARLRTAVSMPIENRVGASIAGYESTRKWVQSALSQFSQEKIQVFVCIDTATWLFDWDACKGMIRCGYSQNRKIETSCKLLPMMPNDFSVARQSSRLRSVCDL